MKRMTIALLLSLVLGPFSSVCMAQQRSSNTRSSNNKEMVQAPTRPGGNSMSRPGSSQNNVKPSNNSAPRPGFGQQNNQINNRPQTPPSGRPNQPNIRPSGPSYRPTPPPPRPTGGYIVPDPLSDMVRYTLGSGQFVDLWQINYDTYLLKYRVGNRYYSRYLYPYSGQYGPVNNISLNWSPNSFMSLIPSFQLNINL